jgi:hypothetical protein
VYEIIVCSFLHYFVFSIRRKIWNIMWKGSIDEAHNQLSGGYFAQTQTRKPAG